jgi:diguanylate cyclase (GGDEF)-like protein
MAAVWLSTVLIGSWVASGVNDDRREARVKTEQQVKVLSKMVAAHDRFEIAMADQVIKSLIAHMSDDLFNGDTAGGKRATFEALLAEHRDRLPGIASFTVVGADGIRRFGVAGKNFTNLSKREYFTFLRDGKGSIFVSPAEDGLASGKQGVHVARVYKRLDGSFGGLVVINLAVTDVFKPYYTSLGLTGDVRIQLRSDAKLLMEYPERLDAALSPEIGALILRGASSGLVRERLSGEDWVAAMERLPETNLYAQASVSETKALAPVEAEAWHAGVMLAVTVFGSGMATVAMLIALMWATRASLAFVKMRWMATHDKLTGLPNRAFLADRFTKHCESLVAKGHGVALTFIDLDKFKAVNDTHGHQAGDELLKQVSARFKEAAGPDDLVCRLSGDEFLIVASTGKVDDSQSSGEALMKRLCEDILKTMALPFDLRTATIQSGASLGVSRYGFDGQDIDTLSHNADTAMYHAKQNGRGNYAIYNAGMEAADKA